jgi:hypothetical protein
MFLSVLRHLKIQKPTSQQGRKNKQEKIHADILELCFIIKMSHISGKGLEPTNQFCIFYMGQDKFTTHLDQQIF